MLPFRRFCNLVYYWVRSRLEQAAAGSFDKKAVEKIRRQLESFERSMDPPREVAGVGVPSWWKGEEEAAASTLAAARALGFNVDPALLNGG